jgi:glycosyltransferase involved in cell wall biosynthesis
VRILWVSNAPWANTGYGTQTAQAVRSLAKLGHEMGIFAFYGLAGGSVPWEGFKVYPAGLDLFGGDLLADHADRFGADLVIILFDAFAMNHDVIKRMPAPVWFWMPVDCEPLSRADGAALQHSGSQPVAMSRFGYRMLEQEGFSPFYVPHGIDTSVYVPADRAEARKAFHLPEDAFIVGMNVMNKDKEDRKAFWEQLSAFALLRRRHSDVLLQMHSVPHPGMSGYNLLEMASFLGIEKDIRWANPYDLLAGNYTAADMATWYNGLDLYSGCSQGEGFGLPLVEAQACGIPVVATDASAMTELAAKGWLVEGEPGWQKGHRTTWTDPSIAEITAVYEKAYNGGITPRRKAAARKFALGYDADLVAETYWRPVLAEAEKRLDEDPHWAEKEEAGWWSAE